MDANDLSVLNETLQEKLVHLNTMDPGTISKEFERLGITGVPGAENSCPVVWWLRKEFPSVNGVTVGTTVVMLEDTYPISVQFLDDYENIKEFIIEFDSQHYPELIADD
jgi:hypothetical protein